MAQGKVELAPQILKSQEMIQGFFIKGNNVVGNFPPVAGGRKPVEKGGVAQVFQEIAVHIGIYRIDFRYPEAFFVKEAAELQKGPVFLNVLIDGAQNTYGGPAEAIVLPVGAGGRQFTEGGQGLARPLFEQCDESLFSRWFQVEGVFGYTKRL